VKRAEIRANMGLGEEGRPRGIHWDPVHKNERVHPQMSQEEAEVCAAAMVEESGDEKALETLQLCARTSPTAAALLPKALEQIRVIRAMRQGGR
jgi:hypothetical protein